jgi:hypothetical protein
MKNMVALIINPYVSDFKLYDEWMHPIGLYFLYNFFEKIGITPFFFNFLDPGSHTQEKRFGTGTFESYELPKPLLYNSLKRKYKLYGVSLQSFIDFLSTIPKPDIVCIGGMMTYWAPGIIETYTIVRKYMPDTSIYCGGIAAQLIPEYLKKHMPRCQVVGDIGGFLSSEVVAKHINKTTNEIYKENLSLDSCIGKNIKFRHAPVLLSLGCPMRCTYCASSVLQPQYKIRSIDIVLHEIQDSIEKYNVTDFAFYDDALLFEKSKILYPFLDRLSDLNIKVRFHTPNGLHVRYADRLALEKMKIAGFETIRFGYESGQTHHQNQTSGKVNRAQLQEKVTMALQCGFSGNQIGVYVMGGLPNQTPDDLIDEMDFIHSLGVTVKPVFVSPVPGTQLFKYYSEQFPQIKTDPLWHNDTFFITNLEFWDEISLESIRQKARTLNSQIG